ncbi:MAG TPA: hypothetical protein VEX65_13440 [Flavisolibacter sp.]|nr:hypothetical protein [Flavisolibacter sp.]
MRWLLFLSRLAFICNVFFLLAVSLQFLQWIKQQDARATVIVLGYVMAAIINPLTNLFIFILFFAQRQLFNQFPRWLVSINLSFLFIQITYLIFLHGH